MANFVLVHGAMHGGWCWKNVRSILAEAGHLVLTPTLTGQGKDAGNSARKSGLKPILKMSRLREKSRRKINIKDIIEESCTSPKGKFAGASKEISVQLRPVTDTDQTYAQYTSEFNCAPDVERELTKIVLGVYQCGFDALRSKFSR